MSEATSAYTLKDLMLRVALAAKIAYYGSDGQGKACIPVETDAFDTCLRCVNDGIKMFIAHAPINGWQWRNRIASITFATVETTGTVDSGSSTTLVDATLSDTYDTDDDVNGYYVYDITKEIYALITDYATATGTVTVAAWLNYDETASSETPAASDSFSITNLKTVAGDKARYYLPDTFMGEYTGKITYAKDSNIGHIIDWTHEGDVRFQREGSVNTGNPTIAAIRPSPIRRRWELIVDPSPTEAKTIKFPYRIGFNDMQAVVGISTASGDTSVTIGGLANLYPDDYFNGWYAYVVSGTGINSYAPVTDYAGSTGAFTVADWLSCDGSAGGTNPSSDASYVFVTDGYKHPAGAQFDEAILSACKAQAEMEFEDMPGFMDKFLKLDLPDAHKIDGRSGPKSVGIMKSGGQGRQHWRTWSNVTHIDD